MITTYYQDQFNCEGCGHSYIIKVPVVWASTNLDEFNCILFVQEQHQIDHRFCHIIEGIKKYLSNPELLLKQPVIIKVDMT